MPLWNDVKAFYHLLGWIGNNFKGFKTSYLQSTTHINIKIVLIRADEF